MDTAQLYHIHAAQAFCTCLELHTGGQYTNAHIEIPGRSGVWTTNSSIMPSGVRTALLPTEPRRPSITQILQLKLYIAAFSIKGNTIKQSLSQFGNISFLTLRLVRSQSANHHIYPCQVKIEVGMLCSFIFIYFFSGRRQGWGLCRNISETCGV